MIEEHLIRSTEENRAMLVHNAVQSAGDMFEMVDSTASDVRAFMASDRTGDISLEQSQEFSQLAGWRQQVSEVLAGSIELLLSSNQALSQPLIKKDYYSFFISDNKPITNMCQNRFMREYWWLFVDADSYGSCASMDTFHLVISPFKMQ